MKIAQLNIGDMFINEESAKFVQIINFLGGDYWSCGQSPFFHFFEIQYEINIVL